LTEANVNVVKAQAEKSVPAGAAQVFEKGASISLPTAVDVVFEEDTKIKITEKPKLKPSEPKKIQSGQKVTFSKTITLKKVEKPQVSVKGELIRIAEGFEVKFNANHDIIFQTDCEILFNGEKIKHSVGQMVLFMTNQQFKCLVTLSISPA
jgi:hypothetical protein